MNRFLILPTLAAAVSSLAALEPDGSRPLGIVPPYQAQPSPPPWLRGLSHALAESLEPGTRHYVYEAYADGAGAWLVRYRRFPGAGEALAELQVALLFGSDPDGECRRLEADAIRFARREARWEASGEAHTFTLVDHRDLVRK